MLQEMALGEKGEALEQKNRQFMHMFRAWATAHSKLVRWTSWVVHMRWTYWTSCLVGALDCV